MYEYYVHYPEGYELELERHWPLMITLHGAGERHVALSALQQHHYYLSVYELTSRQYPSLVVVPHCPPRQYWQPDQVEELLVHLLQTLRADEERVYLTGFSMGGYGTWHTAGMYPDRYAAIAPVCGGGDPDDAPRLKDLPTWAFHGAKDDVVPVAETLEMIEALVAAGAHPRVTIYEEGNHNVWDETFANPDLYAWFLEHKRSDRIHEEAA